MECTNVLSFQTVNRASEPTMQVPTSKGGSRAMLLGGARTVGGVRARRREVPSSKCDRGSSKRLPRELRQGSGGAKIGLLES